jgi:short subunit dehydrogenase-like uncharacterized protein
MVDREFDIVLFGATGFVGNLAAAHLATAAGPEVRVALSGRSLSRLAAVRGQLGEAARTWGLVEVDATDTEGLMNLASRTSVLATTVGPYARYGREVVRAAADQGTHYADLTGEMLFVRWTLDEIAGRARETGARIVHSCGFDSIPSDLGVLLTAGRAAADGQGTLENTTLVVRSIKGGISGGTIDSFRNQVITADHDPAALRVLNDPYALSPRRADEPTMPPLRPGPAGRLRRLVPAERDHETGRWMGPFVMADYNTRLVRLSNTLTDWSYGRALSYREVTDFGSSLAGPVVAAGMAIGLGALRGGLAWAVSRALLDRFLPRPGQGPRVGQRTAGRFRMEISATTTTGAHYRTTVAAPYDPGYGGTAIMLVQSALCLALDGPRLPNRSGVLTPATAMGDVLVDRLRAHGFTFEVERVD